MGMLPNGNRLWIPCWTFIGFIQVLGVFIFFISSAFYLGCSEEENLLAPPSRTREHYIRVPEDYVSLRDAASVAATGDTIALGTGYYDKDEIFLPNGVSLIGTTGAESKATFANKSLHILEGTEKAYIQNIKFEIKDFWDGGIKAHLRSRAELIVKNCEFVPSTTVGPSGRGHGIRTNGYGGILTVEGCRFSGFRDKDSERGSSIRSSGILLKVEIRDCQFTGIGNDSGGSAVIINKAGFVTVSNCDFSEYSGGGWGVLGSYTLDGDTTIRDCTFVSCNGKVISASQNTLTVNNCLFSYCGAPQIILEESSMEFLRLLNSRFEFCQTPIAYVENGQTRISECTFYRNEDGDGNNFNTPMFPYMAPVISRCTFYLNDCSLIYQVIPDKTEIYKTIIAENQMQIVEHLYLGPSFIQDSNFFHSSYNAWGDLLQSCYGTCLEVDPLFCDPESGDLRLQSDSPLVVESNIAIMGSESVGCDPIK